jgi:hypothetical protein
VSTIISLTSICNAYLSSSLGMDYAKTVVNPIRQVAKRSTIRGLKDDYYHLDADVVVLAGETHLYRKPVSNPSHSRVADTQPNIPF